MPIETKPLVTVSTFDLEGMQTPLYRVEAGGTVQTLTKARDALRIVHAALGVTRKPREKRTPKTDPKAK